MNNLSWSCTWMVILPSASNPITLRCCCPLITTASTPRVSMAETWCVDLTEGKILSNILCASRGATGCLNSQDPAPSTATGTTGHHCHCWLVLCPVPLYNKNWLILHSPYNCLTSQLKLLVTDESCIPNALQMHIKNFGVIGRNDSWVGGLCVNVSVSGLLCCKSVFLRTGDGMWLAEDKAAKMLSSQSWAHHLFSKPGFQTNSNWYWCHFNAHWSDPCQIGSCFVSPFGR